MYYNRILRVWVVDGIDYFLISTLIGSLVASRLKNYLSEKVAMERLKRSIINKSNLVDETNRAFLNSREAKIQKVYKFALTNRGGDFKEFEAVLSNEVFNLAKEIKGIVERLAVFLKRRELKGFTKIFFRNGRLILELLLYHCNINISYSILSKGLNTQFIVLTTSIGGTSGFLISWFSVGASLVAPPLLATTLFLRSVVGQFINQGEYLNFKKMVNQILDDPELRETLKGIFMEMEEDVRPPNFWNLDMNKPITVDPNSPLLQSDLTSKSAENFEEFIKARMEEELGLIENPNETQLEGIINEIGKKKRKSKGKTVFFGEIIKKMPPEDTNLLDSDIVDVEIIKNSIRIKLDDD